MLHCHLGMEMILQKVQYLFYNSFGYPVSGAMDQNTYRCTCDECMCTHTHRHTHVSSQTAPCPLVDLYILFSHCKWVLLWTAERDQVPPNHKTDRRSIRTNLCTGKHPIIQTPPQATPSATLLPTQNTCAWYNILIRSYSLFPKSFDWFYPTHNRVDTKASRGYIHRRHPPAHFNGYC